MTLYSIVKTLQPSLDCCNLEQYLGYKKTQSSCLIIDINLMWLISKEARYNTYYSRFEHPKQKVILGFDFIYNVKFSTLTVLHQLDELVWPVNDFVFDFLKNKIETHV